MQTSGNYFSWLLHQLKGWPQQNYYLFWFAFGCQLMTLVDAKITAVTVITFIGTTLGVLCVLAINATKAVNGWLGLLSAACFILLVIPLVITFPCSNRLLTWLPWICRC